MKMASDMSYPTVIALLRILTAFWRRIYDGIDVHGLERIATLGRTHTLVYVPCHRSHVDYLLLSYLLFQRGLMIPHIAAGENMNLPFVGNLLRRGGAFFMQRSFRGDALHAALFSEYLYEVYRRGHCVEFFPEGGRSRTGRLLPTRIGAAQDDDRPRAARAAAAARLHPRLPWLRENSSRPLPISMNCAERKNNANRSSTSSAASGLHARISGGSK